MVQGHATQELHIKVAHFHDPLGAFADHGKCLGQYGVKAFTSRNPGFELGGLRFQRFVRQPLKTRLHCVNTSHGSAVML